MKATIVLVILSVIGCGKEVSHVKSWGKDGHVKVIVPDNPPIVRQARPTVTGDEDLHAIVDAFYSDAERLGHATTTDFKSISMSPDNHWGADNPDAIGYCVWWSTESGREFERDVYFLQSFWDQASFKTRRTLVYHENGHCALSLQHVPVGSGAIMEPIVLSDFEVEQEWASLVVNEFNSSTVR